MSLSWVAQMMLMRAIKIAYMTLVRKPEEKRGRLGVHRIGTSEPQRNRT
jgi:hypothetical protein